LFIFVLFVFHLFVQGFVFGLGGHFAGALWNGSKRLFGYKSDITTTTQTQTIIHPIETSNIHADQTKIITTTIEHDNSNPFSLEAPIVSIGAAAAASDMLGIGTQTATGNAPAKKI
jgi:hypothetical protein